MKPNKNTTNSKKFKSFLLFSLLLHLILIIIFLINAFNKKDFKILSQKLAKKKDDTPAALLPRKSEFGTTVLFDDKAVFTPPKSKFMAHVQQKGKESIEKPEIPEKPKPQPKEQPPTKEKTEPKDKPKSEIKKTKKDPESKPKPQPEPKDDKEVKERIKKVIEKQKLLAKAANLPRISKIKTIGQAEQNKSPMQPPKKKSIIAMTNGFIENLKDEGNDWLKRDGDKNKRPSFKELKYISYEQKINWYLQNSWKNNFGHEPWQRVLEGTVVVDFQITANGNVEHVQLLKSSGHNKLDDMVVKSITFAAPFPPLPQHFGTNIYKTGRIIYVHSHRMKI